MTSTTPRRALRDTPPRPQNPPTQTLFARGPGAVGIHTTGATNYYDSFRSWAGALDHPGTLMRATPPLDEELGMFMSWGVGGGDFQAFLW